MTTQPGEEVAAQLEKMHKIATEELGVREGLDPFITLSFMSLPVIPELRLTTRGIIDVNTQQYL